MKKSNLLGKILMVGLLFIFFSCNKDEFINDNSDKSILVSDIGDENNRIATFVGPKVVMGNGYAFSWIRIIDDNTPLEIGIEMTPEVLNNLPKDSGFKDPVIIPLPEIATETTPFYHIVITWNPEGFSNIENFKEAHFNFYFYTIPLGDRLTIPAWSEETDVHFSTYPPKNYMPADYFPMIKDIGSYAETGRHWLLGDPKNYSPLSHTLTYGTYEGKIVFMNPIATFALVKSGIETKNNISQPLYYQVNKPYPKEYTITLNKNDQYTVYLTNFIRR